MNNTETVGENCSNCKSGVSECLSCLPGLKLVSGTCAENNKSNTINVGVVVGVAIGAIVLVGVIIFIIVYFVLLPKKNKDNKHVELGNVGKDDEAVGHDEGDEKQDKDDSERDDEDEEEDEEDNDDEE